MELDSFSLFVLIPIICIAGLGLIFMLLIGLFLTYQSIETLLSLGGWTPAEHPWRQLARQYQLDSKPGPQLTGAYRGHKLQLKLVKGKYQNTVLTLWANPTQAPSAPVASLGQAPSSLTELVQMMAPHGLPELWLEKISIDLRNCRVIYQKEGVEPKPERLQHIFDVASNLLEVCPQIVALGGATVPALTELATTPHPLQYVALRCLYHISQETRERLGSQTRDLLCPTCFVHPAQIPTPLSWRKEWVSFLRSIPPRGQLPWERLSYYGCRQCGQSQQFIELKGGQAVVVLDETATERIIEQPDQVQVNWFAHPQPFDFDEVEIIQANDEAVERFAVQLGNDTDPVRHPRYRQMRCRIATSCSLSTNTLRILQRTFGEVGSTPDAALLSAKADNRLRPGRALSIALKPGRNVTPPRTALDLEEFGVEGRFDS